MSETTITITIDVKLKEPLTEQEHDTIVGNIGEHISAERDEGINGFTKIHSAHVRAADTVEPTPAA